MFIKTNNGIVVKFDPKVHNIVGNILLYYNSTVGAILAQSESLADLCDGFEFWNNLDRANGMFVYYDNTDWEVKGGAFERLKRAIEYCKMKEGCCIAKGYIRTKKGLIYIAEMNDNGELELVC